jgi:hypothetical protein
VFISIFSISKDLGHFMLVHVLLNVGEFRPRVHPELTNKNPKALAYQSSAKAEEGLTRDAMRITETIWSCDKDEGLNTQGSIGIAFMHSINNNLLLSICKTIHTHIK